MRSAWRNLTIRNLDDHLRSKLRLRAARNGRSMEEEARLSAGGRGSNVHNRANPDWRRRHPLALCVRRRPLARIVAAQRTRAPPRRDSNNIFILDTNVALRTHERRRCERRRFSSGSTPYPKNDMFTTALSCAEIWYGIALGPKGRKKRRLTGVRQEMFNEDFRGRILPFDEAVGQCISLIITARRKRLGRRVGTLYSQIAAIARANEMTVATRNVIAFSRIAILPLVDPWASEERHAG